MYSHVYIIHVQAYQPSFHPQTSVKEQAVHTVQHYQFISWPDHGAPSTPLPVLGFLRHIRTAHPPSGPPLLVHCSAGVGRTGTLIALDSLLQELEEGWKEVNVFETVRRMRRSRPSMVQSLVCAGLSVCSPLYFGFVWSEL